MQIEQTPPKETVIIIRPSFKKICGKDACRAALFNHLLYCVACKVVGGSDYWYGTQAEIHKGLDESWSLSKVNKELDALVEQGLIGQRHNEAKKWDRTMQYFFSENEAKILKEICKKEDVDLSSIGLSSQVTHLLNLRNALRKNTKSITSEKQMDYVNLTNPFGKSNGAIPKVTTKVTTKVLSKVTDNSADAPVFGVPQQQKEKRTPKRTSTFPTQESLIDPKEIIFSEEEDRIYGYWCNLKAHNGFKQKKSTSMKEHFKRLAPVISSQEELQMLWDYARGLAFNQGKGIYPGTLANAYPGWRSSLPVQNAPDSPPTHTKRQPKPDHEIVFWTTDPKGVSSKHSNPLSWDYMTVAEAKAQDNGYKDGRLLIPIDEDNVKARKITLQQQQAKVAVNA